MDTNYDGVFEEDTDMGLDGVVVELYEAGDIAGTDDPVATDITSDGGHYLFDELREGEYFIHVPASEFAEGAPLEDKESAPGNGGDDMSDDDSGENGVDGAQMIDCLLYTSPSPRDQRGSRMPSSA